MGTIKSNRFVVEVNLPLRGKFRCRKQARLFHRTGKVTRAELAKLPTPPATETHIPIPHAAVVETLSHRHIGVVGEEFAVSSDGMEMLGVLDLLQS